MLLHDHLVAVKIDAVETFDGFMPCRCLSAWQLQRGMFVDHYVVPKRFVPLG